jgi:hypothetical protein
VSAAAVCVAATSIKKIKFAANPAARPEILSVSEFIARTDTTVMLPAPHGSRRRTAELLILTLRRDGRA